MALSFIPIIVSSPVLVFLAIQDMSLEPSDSSLTSGWLITSQMMTSPKGDIGR